MQIGKLGHHGFLFGLLFNSDILISVCFSWLRAVVAAAVGELKINFSNNLGIALGSLSEKQRTGKQRESYELQNRGKATSCKTEGKLRATETSTEAPYVSGGSSMAAHGFIRRENCVKFQRV